jgi:Ca2+-binding RTX toxin-like protein
MATINGSDLDDKGIFELLGTDSADTINGRGGEDWLFGFEGNDTLDGGTGADFMDGGAGNDTYIVDNVDDRISEDTALGGGGIDLVKTTVSYRLPGAADDSAPGGFPGQADNRIENLTLMEAGGAINGTGNEFDNTISGNSFDNRIEGRDGNDTLFGFDGDDRLFGGRDADLLSGGLKNDLLDGGSGADQMFGGGGDDTYFVDNTGDVVSEFLGDGYDIVIASVSFTLDAGLERLELAAGAGAIDGTGSDGDNALIGNDNANTLRGLNGKDVLVGNGGDDTLRGGDDNDVLKGGGGADTLNGGNGDDDMVGGLDNDTYFVDSLGDVVEENAGEGRDTVFASGLANFTLPTNVEDLVLISGDNGTGNALNNTITGNILDNIIDGRGGADTMQGRQGDDTYIVDNARDVVVEARGEGSDTVMTSVSYTLGAGVEVETLRTTKDAGTAAINLTGNAFGNALIGNDGANVLNGGGGSDGLDGRGGIDTASYETNSAHVVVVLGQSGAPGLAYEFLVIPGSGEQIVSVDTLVSIENVRGSAFDDTLIGNEVANELRGNNGNDTLNGLGGVDTLIGGFGNDTYIIDNAGDVITELNGQGTDEVRTSVSYTLGAGADIETFRTTDNAGTAAINLTGNDIDNTIFGNAGNNVIRGGGGDDFIIGGPGVDSLVGGSEADTFLWRDVHETGTEANFADVIADFDFAAGDGIDLAFDANVVAPGFQPFTFIGENDFTLNAATSDPTDVVPGEIRYVHSNGDTLLLLQTGTSADVEAVIRIAGIVTPEASWFVL